MVAMYQNNGLGRPPLPQGSYRQNANQLPPPPPLPPQGQYGGHHSFTGGGPSLHPSYAGIGPPGTVPYTAVHPNSMHHGYGSARMIQGHYGPHVVLPPIGQQQQPRPPPPPPPPAPPSQHQQQHHTFAPGPSAYPPPPPPPPPPPLAQSSQPPPPSPPRQQHLSGLASNQPLPPSHHPPYYPTSQFSHFAPPSQPPPSQDRPPTPPPPPPPSPPPPLSSSFPPPPPPPQTNSSASQPHSHSIKQHKENKPPPPAPPSHGSWAAAPPPPPPKETNTAGSGWGAAGPGQAKPSMTPKQRPGPQPAAAKPSQPPAAMASKGETEEERRLRKKKEFEKKKQEEKRQREKESQAAAALSRKNQVGSSLQSIKVASGTAVAASRGDGRVEKKPQHVGADKIDNRLKKPTTFLCKLKFRNELPDPTAQPKLLSFNTNKDQYTKYTITSLEKMYKPNLYIEPDLGIPLDLLDISVYNPPKVKQAMDPEDEELLRDEEMTTPNKQDGIRRKERPTDKGVSWLVKTQYISPISLDPAKQPITEKQAKELRETKEGHNAYLESLNNREQQIKAIEESFRVSKLRPVHQTKPGLEPVEILPLIPDFDRWDGQFVLMAFDGEPTAESEAYSKLEPSVRDELESRAIVKSFVHSGTDQSKQEKFLAYMVPGVEELMKDMYDEDEEEMSYTWVREYHWDLRAEDPNNPTTYVFSFDDKSVRYLPLPTKLVLQKRRAKEGRCGDDIESHHPVPSRVTVRQRPLTHKEEELRDSGRALLMEGHANAMGGITGSKHQRSPDEDIQRSSHKVPRMQEPDDNLSGEEYMSE